MAEQQISEVGDLTGIVKLIEKIFKQEFGSTPALAIAFTLDPDRSMVHWCTNVTRVDGIALLTETAKKMQAQAN